MENNDNEYNIIETVKKNKILVILIMVFIIVIMYSFIGILPVFLCYYFENNLESCLSLDYYSNQNSFIDIIKNIKNNLVLFSGNLISIILIYLYITKWDLKKYKEKYYFIQGYSNDYIKHYIFRKETIIKTLIIILIIFGGNLGISIYDYFHNLI